jgi:hypothetical protein
MFDLIVLAERECDTIEQLRKKIGYPALPIKK